ncbi:MAG: Ig domain-containing protein [Candidatus Hodarchaeales archaeon]
MKNRYLLVIILFVIAGNSLFFSIGCRQSLSPIIDTPEPIIYAVVGQAFSLVYFVLDDDPWNYELRQDNSTLARGIIETRRLEFNINYVPEGQYNYTLTVEDYSGNSANRTIQVIISPEPLTTMTTTTPMEVASSGLEYLFASFAMIICTGYRKCTKNRK